MKLPDPILVLTSGILFFGFGFLLWDDYEEDYCHPWKRKLGTTCYGLGGLGFGIGLGLFCRGWLF